MTKPKETAKPEGIAKPTDAEVAEMIKVETAVPKDIFKDYAPSGSVIQWSEKRGNILKALFGVQRVLGVARKSSDNDYFHSSYADLAEVWNTIRGPLMDAGLLVIQVPQHSRRTRKTILGDMGPVEVELPVVEMHNEVVHVDSGEYLRWQNEMIPSTDTPQAIGSCITYLRRYNLMSICNVAPEEDDGNAASGRSQRQGGSGATNPPPQGQAPKGAPQTQRGAKITKQMLDTLKVELAKAQITAADFNIWKDLKFDGKDIHELPAGAYQVIMATVRNNPQEIQMAQTVGIGDGYGEGSIG